MADFTRPQDARAASLVQRFSPPPTSGPVGEPIAYPPQVYDPGDPILARNPYGLPVRSRVEIARGTYIDPMTGREKAYFGLTLDEALVTLSQVKNYVKTPVNGRGGDLKEFWSYGDWSVKIQHVFWEPTPFRYPSSLVATLRDLVKVPGPVRVQGGIFDAMQIYYLVIEQLDLPASGSRNVQPFTLTAVSDTPLEVELLAGN